MSSISLNKTKVSPAKDMVELNEKQRENLKREALNYIIPHFASNTELAKGPKIFVRGEGCYVYDINGKGYLDTFASLTTTICGHHRPEVDKAIRDQLEKLEFFPNYVDAFTIPLIELSRKVAEIMPGDLEVSFFVNSGSEANETAMKMARQYHLENDQPHRFKFLARHDSYHATTLGGSSVTGLRWFREYFEPLLPGAVFVPSAKCCECELAKEPETCGLGCLKAIERTIQFEGPDTIAAIIMDPVPGSNTGYPLPPDGYLRGLREMCDKYGILIIFDEVQTGFGKTGKWFACEHWDVVPDIMTIGKGFTGGYIPLGATVTTQKIAEKFRRPGHEFRSGSTYGGHTVACAATLANIQYIQDNNLVEKTAEKSIYTKDKLETLKKHHIVGEISGIGLLLAVKLMADRQTRKKLDPALGVGNFIRQWCWDNGMIMRNNGEILVVAPAIVITYEEIDFMVDLMDLALTATEKHFGF